MNTLHNMYNMYLALLELWFLEGGSSVALLSRVPLQVRRQMAQGKSYRPQQWLKIKSDSNGSM